MDTSEVIHQEPLAMLLPSVLLDISVIMEPHLPQTQRKNVLKVIIVRQELNYQLDVQLVLTIRVQDTLTKHLVWTVQLATIALKTIVLQEFVQRVIFVQKEILLQSHALKVTISQIKANLKVLTVLSALKVTSVTQEVS